MIFLAIMAPPFTNTDLQGVRQLPSNESGRSLIEALQPLVAGMMPFSPVIDPAIIVGFDERAGPAFQERETT